jgi:hypothetical protein
MEEAKEGWEEEDGAAMERVVRVARRRVAL